MSAGRGLVWLLAGVTVVSLGGAGVAVWALTMPEGEPPSAVAPDGGPAADQAAPAPEVFIGAELEWLLLTDDEIQELFPGTVPGEVTADFGHEGESVPLPSPAVCLPFWSSDSGLVVGARTHRWEDPTSDNGWRGQWVLQLPDSQTAENWQGRVRDAAEQCETFYGSEDAFGDPMHFTLLAQAERENADVIVGVLDDGWDPHLVVGAQTRNVVVDIVASHEGVSAEAAERIAEVVADRLEQASQRLAEGGA